MTGGAIATSPLPPAGALSPFPGLPALRQRRECRRRAARGELRSPFAQRARDGGSLKVVDSAVPDLDRGEAAPRGIPDLRPLFFPFPDLRRAWLRGSCELAVAGSDSGASRETT
jgi:hypothetical protein